MTTPTSPALIATRRRRLAFALVATVAASVWAAVQPDDATQDSSASPRPPRSRTSTDAGAARAAPAPVAWPEPPEGGARPPWREAQADGIAAWGPSPPPPPPPAPPPPPPAAPAPPAPPPFPYTLIGRLDDGESTALLSNPTRSFGAKAADVIDGAWRVDAVDRVGVTLTWLPGGVTRTLAFPTP